MVRGDTNSTSTKSVKVDKWDTNAVKNALDDAAKAYMKDSVGLKESFFYVDTRLILCTLAVLFAGFGCLWDWLHPFPKSRFVIIVCVGSYFILACIISFYLMYIEKNKIFIGYEKDRAGIDPDNKWVMSSGLKRYDDVYSLSMEFVDGLSNARRQQEIKMSVANFFDEAGVLCFDIFEKELRKLQDDLSKDKKTN